MYDVEVFYEELESLTGKIFQGDLTPIVFDLLKESQSVEDLLRYLKKEENSDVDSNETQDAVRKESYNRPCFEEWFLNAEQL